MRLSLPTALALAVLANLLPGSNRSMDDPSARGGSSGQSPAGAATGQASEGSTDDRKAPARPSSQ